MNRFIGRSYRENNFFYNERAWQGNNHLKEGRPQLPSQQLVAKGFWVICFLGIRLALSTNDLINTWKRSQDSLVEAVSPDGLETKLPVSLEVPRLPDPDGRQHPGPGSLLLPNSHQNSQPPKFPRPPASPSGWSPSLKPRNTRKTRNEAKRRRNDQAGIIYLRCFACFWALWRIRLVVYRWRQSLRPPPD